MILVPVCRSTLRTLYNHSTQSYGLISNVLRKLLFFVPLDHHIEFHKLIAVIILVATIGHTISHFINFALVPTLTLTIFQGPWALLSGGLLCFVMLIIFSAAHATVRRANFEIFLDCHHFYVLFFILLIVHGKGGLNPHFWMYFVGPGGLWAFEQLLRFWRQKQKVVVLSVTLLEDVLELEFAKVGVLAEPYQCGQFISIRCPVVSPLESHPFTISSAPAARTVTVHMRILGSGSWTRQVAAYMGSMCPIEAQLQFQEGMLVIRDGKSDECEVKKERRDADHVWTDQYFQLRHFDPIQNGLILGKSNGPDGQPFFEIDGPHSAPTQHLPEYTQAIVIGAGIGATPMAAVLQSVAFHAWNFGIGRCYPNSAYFVWICAYKDLHAFKWLIRRITKCQRQILKIKAENQKRFNSGAPERYCQIHVYVTQARGRSKGTDDTDHKPGFWGRQATVAPVAGNRLISIPTGISSSTDVTPSASSATTPRQSISECFGPNSNSKRKVTFGGGSDEMGWNEEDLYGELECGGSYSGNQKEIVWKNNRFNDVYVHSGRPNWTQLFEEVSKNHPANPNSVSPHPSAPERKCDFDLESQKTTHQNEDEDIDSDVGVMFCGSPAIAKDLQKQCYAISAKRTEGHASANGLFKLHVENF